MAGRWYAPVWGQWGAWERERNLTFHIRELVNITSNSKTREQPTVFFRNVKIISERIS